MDLWQAIFHCVYYTGANWTASFSRGQWWAMRRGAYGIYGNPGNLESVTYRIHCGLKDSNPTLTASNCPLQSGSVCSVCAPLRTAARAKSENWVYSISRKSCRERNVLSFPIYCRFPKAGRRGLGLVQLLSARVSVRTVTEQDNEARNADQFQKDPLLACQETLDAVPNGN